EYLPVEEIDRIEIVRGPRSSRDGSEAGGGVIQIFTRRGRGEPQLTASAGGRSHNTKNASAGFCGSTSGLSYSASSSYLGSDGYASCRGTPVAPGGGCFTSDFTPDGFHSASQSARTGYDYSAPANVQVLA